MQDPQVCPSYGESLPKILQIVLAASQKPSQGSAEKGVLSVPSIAAYQIVRILGQGGMGAVYLAEDNTLKRRVAIKVMSKKLSEGTRGRNRFLCEARTMATVQHPHVVHVHTPESGFCGGPILRGNRLQCCIIFAFRAR